MNNTSQKDATVFSTKWAAVALASLLVISLAMVAVLLTIDVLQWMEIVGFIDWMSKATAFGAAFAGLAALTAAWLAYHGVRQTIRSTEVREKDTRLAVDTREREKARHERFTTIVSQLGSEQATVRLGGLLAVSALSDEWEREARRLIRESPSAGRWDDHERAWVEAVDRLAGIRQRVAELRTANPVPMPEQEAEWTGWIIEAEEAAAEARDRYTLTRDVVPLVAKDAVTQRDSCLEMVTAYLRAAPRHPTSHPVDLVADVPDEDDKVRRASKDSKGQRPPVPSNGLLNDTDAAARSEAIGIIRQRTAVDNQYPWPTKLLDLSGAHVEHIDLSKADLKSANLSGTNLAEADLPGADLSRADLIGADLSGANLSRADLFGANLSGANLSRADLSGADLNWVNFSGANLRHVDFSGANSDGVNFSRTDLSWADLSKAMLTGADLSGANLNGTDLTKADLIWANLSGANLQAYLREAKLSLANLSRADLRGADLRGANLSRANLSGADLFRARLSGADLSGADLSGADLREASLSGADLREANMEGARLSFTRLDDADLSGTNFLLASLGNQEKGEIVLLADVTVGGSVVCARWDKATRWPEGFDPAVVAARQLDLARTRHGT